MSEENISKSKAKRLAIEKARKAQKNAKRLRVTFTIVCLVAIVGGIAAGIIIYNASKFDYGRCFTKEGLIDINIDEYCTSNYESISLNKADLLPDDATVQADIDSFCSNYKELSEDENAVVKEGDVVNVCYTVSAGGQVYNTVTAEMGGEDMTADDSTLGSSLIGHKVGDSFSVDTSAGSEMGAADNESVSGDVAVSDNESVSDNDVMAVSEGTSENGASVSGNSGSSNVVYDITITGVYTIPEFTDELVAANLGGEYTTAAEYRQAVVDYYYDINLEKAIKEALLANSVITAYPEDYYNYTRDMIAQSEGQQAEYYQQVYDPNFTAWNLVGVSTQEEYDEHLKEEAVASVEEMLCMQAVYVKAGLTNTKEEVKNYAINVKGWTEENYNEYIKTYGYPFFANYAMTDKVLTYLKENVTIVE